MMMKRILFAAAMLVSTLAFAQPGKVEVNQTGENWQLLVDGSPYYIKGAGGQTNLDKLVEIGGNTIRTWSTDNAKEVLDEAHAKGIKVMMGLWAQHERHGFDYDDPVKVKAQLDGFRAVVNQLKDHPALLIWAVGNEVDLFYTNTNVWYAIEDIAKMIHEVDPNHPTCTVTAGLDPAEVKLVNERAPSIDIYGVNTYGDIGNVKKGIRDAGWKGPYMITEWGPNGHWEVAKTKWNAPIEQSSTEKANSYELRYTDFIASDKSMCLGSFVFLWGQKQETTSTWYGLFSEAGESSEALDRLEKIWTGKEPANHCPSIGTTLVNGMNKSESIYLEAEEKYDATVTANDKDGDNLTYRWLIIPESTDIKAGGDAESAPLPVSGVFVKRKDNAATFRAPKEPGSYRLFIFIYDKHNHYAYENVPFFVTPRAADKGPSRPVSFKRMEM